MKRNSIYQDQSIKVHTYNKKTLCLSFYIMQMKRNRDLKKYGADFDDRLIKLVKENAAIYDARHPHYRKTSFRMKNWDNIAKQLGAPSRFLQIKWQNIRYHYLNEKNCLETGTVNKFVRNRRFTEDLKFLKHAVFRRNCITPTKSNCNGSDDSNSCINSDNLASASNTCEVIELDNSEDETNDIFPPQNIPTDQYDQPDNDEEAYGINKNNIKEDFNQSISPTNSINSSRSSPLLTPLRAITRNGNETKILSKDNSQYSEVTIQPLPPASAFNSRLNLFPNDNVLTNSAKRKATSTPTQINSDAIEMYCLSLVDCFRAMTRSERERVKYEFAKILKDAHYKDQL